MPLTKNTERFENSFLSHENFVVKQLVMQHIAYVQTLPNCKGTIIQPDVDPM